MQKTLSGIVVEGNKRGRLLGYPTANVTIDEALPEGVYASTVTIDGDLFEAATFIGSSKTFDDPEYKMESFLFDFDQDIYGKTISVNLLKHIRGNKKFASEKELIDQMEKDVEEIRGFLKENN